MQQLVLLAFDAGKIKKLNEEINIDAQ